MLWGFEMVAQHRLRTPPSDFLLAESNRYVDSLCALFSVDFKTSAALKTYEPREAELYGLPKTHKSGPTPVRPIVSSTDSVTEKLGWMLSRLFTPALQLIDSYIDSSEDLLSFLGQVECLPPGSFVFSLDVNSLYPSVPLFEGANVMFSMLDDMGFEYPRVRDKVLLDMVFNEVDWVRLLREDPDGDIRPFLPAGSVQEFDRAKVRGWKAPLNVRISERARRVGLRIFLKQVVLHCMCNNYFRFGESYWWQRKGAAMGGRLSPAFCILFMAAWEKKLFSRPGCRNFIAWWKRYIDDILSVWRPSSAPYSFFKFIDHCQRVHTNIKLECVCGSPEVPHFPFSQSFESPNTVARDAPDVLGPSFGSFRFSESVLVLICSFLGFRISFQSPLPVLDLQISLRDGMPHWEHYDKPLATEAILFRNSALSTQVQRNTISTEAMRRILHCRSREESAPHLHSYKERLLKGGFSKVWLDSVFAHAKRRVDGVMRSVARGERPLYRSRAWRKENGSTLRRQSARGPPGATAFWIPRVSDAFRSQVVKVVQSSRLPLQVRELSGPSLRKILCRSSLIAPRCNEAGCLLCACEDPPRESRRHLVSSRMSFTRFGASIAETLILGRPGRWSKHGLRGISELSTTRTPALPPWPYITECGTTGCPCVFRAPLFRRLRVLRCVRVMNGPPFVWRSLL